MVNVYKLKFTVLQQEIMRFLFVRAGESFNARRMAERLGVSPPAIAKALPELEKEGLIKIKKDAESGRLAIELNRDGAEVILLKRVENLKLLYESGFVKFLHDKIPGETAILFGSYSTGEDTVGSELDIAIIGKESKIETKEFEESLERKIALHFYPDLKGMDKRLRRDIVNGIVLKGGIEL